MKEYIVKSVKDRGYELFLNEKSLGVLSYSSWYSGNGKISLSNYKTYELKSEGFWNNRMIVLENEKEVLSYKMNWRNGLPIIVGNKKFLLKLKGVFSRTFNLIDEETGKTVLSVDYKLSWRKLKNDFKVYTYEEITNENMMILGVISATIYYLNIIASAAA